MKKATAVFLATLALCTSAHCEEVVREWLTQAALDVDPAGQVAKVTLLEEFPGAVATPAQAIMMRWRFKPAERTAMRSPPGPMPSSTCRSSGATRTASD